MPSLAIIGAQWGDEGKGKITDYLDEKADLIVRFQGGNNAGHTIVADGKTFKLHGLPSGVVRPGKLAVIGNGVVVNLDDLGDEIRQVLDAGGSIDGLRISDRAHLIMDYHKRLDGAEEKYRGKTAVGTTKKGIGPTYQDKIARIGFRAGDLLEEGLLKEKISFVLPYKKDLMEMMGAEACACSDGDLRAKMAGWRDVIGDRICDTSVLINDSLDSGRNVLFEGAQGAMLDIDHGTYPFVTSSNVVCDNASIGAGVHAGMIGERIAIIKAYTTRVGSGPFPTELFDATGDFLRAQGGEFGATTGRPRRCGWLDIVVLREMVRLCDPTAFAFTKVDVLCGLKEVSICTAYELDGEILRFPPQTPRGMERVRPVYETMPGWSEDLSKCGSWESLPLNCRRYIERVEELLGIHAAYISVGPDRNQTFRH
jgi:adenylosuccinate synthase